MVVAAVAGGDFLVFWLFAEDRREHFHGLFGIVGLVVQVQHVTLAHLMGAVMERV